jgi:DNA-binding transcriptional LysR family regulator
MPPRLHPAPAEPYPRIRAIRTLVAIVEAGSITGAARRLGATQPAVSMSLRDLERDFGVPLIDRTARPLRPTHAGLSLFQLASRMLDDIDALYSAVNDAALTALPVLRIGMVVPFGSEMMRGLQQLAVDIQVTMGLTPEMLQALLDRQLDVVIVSDAADGVDGLVRRRLLAEPMVAVFATKREASLTRAELARVARELPLVRYASRSSIGKAIERYLHRIDIDAPHYFEFDTSQSVLTTVVAGLGWAITTPLCVAQCEAPCRRLPMLALPDAPPMRQLFVLHRRNELAQTAARIFGLAERQIRNDLRRIGVDRLPWLAQSFGFGDESTPAPERAARATRRTPRVVLR